MIKKVNIPPISLIVAVDQEGGFGKDGKIPWFFPEDLKHFQTITKNSVCIMGRKTYEDMFEMISAKRKKSGTELTAPILKDRESFVVTSNKDFEAHGAKAVKSIRAAIQTMDENDDRTVFVIGGYRMYVEALAYTNIIYMTIVDGEPYSCDRFFPINVVNQKFELASVEETENLMFVKYIRIKQ